MSMTTGTPAETYERYIVPGIFGPWTDRLIGRVRPQPGDRVLDLACGSGIVTRQIAPMVAPGGSVVGLDVSPPMLAVARSVPLPDGAAPVEWVEASGTQMPLPDDDVDVIVCQQGLQFFPDRAQGAREMHRTLRPGGRLALAVWRSLEHNEVPRAFDRALRDHLGVAAGAAPFSLGDAEELRDLLASAGFEQIEIEAETAPATFESSRLYVDALVEGLAALIPEMAEMTSEQRAEVRSQIHADFAASVSRFEFDGRFQFPMTAHVATARAS